MEQFFKDFLVAISPALQMLIQTLSVILAAQASAWLYKKFQNEKMSLSTEQRYLLDVIVGSAVKAAEQIYDKGEVKRDYAFDIVNQSLEKYGLKFDVSVIYSAIEAAVFDQFKEQPKG